MAKGEVVVKEVNGYQFFSDLSTRIVTISPAFCMIERLQFVSTLFNRRGVL